ncbi:aspartic peptidase domain-containing protein [Russula vinacea]|nr:aspartic peptidase domain-containing protein [Russula vinacea]
MLLVASSLLAPLVVLVQLSAVAGSPILIRDSLISVPITKNIYRNDNGTVDINFASSQSTLDATPDLNLPLSNTNFAYIASMASVPTYLLYNLLVDTGSANTWVGANQPYKETDSSEKTYDFYVKYGTGSVRGREYQDTVTITPGVTIQQSIGVARKSIGIYPSWTDLCLYFGAIWTNVLAVSFDPTTSDTVYGELTFGGTDSTKYTGDITHPRHDSFSCRAYWGLELSFHYGDDDDDTTPIMYTNAGILDTGTSLIYIASDAYQRYVAATGAVHDKATGLLRISTNQYHSLHSLFFNIGGSTYEFTRNAQIFPRILNTDLAGGDKDSIYLVIMEIGNFVPGLQFILGKAFLERFYTVFDTGTPKSVLHDAKHAG